MKLKVISCLAALAVCVVLPAAGQTGRAPAATARLVQEGKANLQSGKVSQAVRVLEKAAKSAPRDGAVQLELGIAYKKSKQYTKARTALTKAWRYARGTPIAAQANRELLSLPADILRPQPKQLVARFRGRRIAPAGLVRVKLLAFTASWAEPCKQLQAAIDKARTEWGDKVEFVSVDVDDPKNESLLDQYDVSPVPTVVFLDEEGNMVSFLIGYGGEDALNHHLRTLTSGAKPPGPTG
ncbi:MAG TPA: thioredoxin domain-containing protein [Candidatus Obscuribacterales bacterium]